MVTPKSINEDFFVSKELSRYDFSIVLRQSFLSMLTPAFRITIQVPTEQAVVLVFNAHKSELMAYDVFGNNKGFSAINFYIKYLWQYHAIHISSLLRFTKQTNCKICNNYIKLIRMCLHHLLRDV